MLVVDDDDDMRALFAMVLRHAGFEVAEAASATEAFVAVCRWSVQCVVLDIMMPGVNGFQVLNALRSQPESWDIKIAVVTCMETAEAARKAWGLGADDYLIKPVDPELMVTRVTQLLAASRAAIRDRRQAELDRLSAYDDVSVS